MEIFTNPVQPGLTSKGTPRMNEFGILLALGLIAARKHHGTRSGGIGTHTLFSYFFSTMSFLLPLGILLGLQGPAPLPATNATNDLPTRTEAMRPPFPATPMAVQNDPRGGDIIIKEMGMLRDKVVADMFCGDGYYTWKLLSAGARVVAIDDDPEVIERMKAWKASQGIGDDRLIVRLTTPGIPGLAPGEADMALITREYSTLINPETWFPEMQAGLTSPHIFFLVNYLPEPSPDGPPISQRRSYDEVSDELMLNGVYDIGVTFQSLPDRYILFGATPPELPDEEDGH